MTKVLVIAELHKESLAPSTATTIAAALKLNTECDVLLACASDSASQNIAGLNGVANVFVAKQPHFQQVIAENLTPFILAIAKDYSHILAPATTFGKNVMPRVAALLDVAQISEVTSIIDQDTFVRPIYAGNAFETVRSKDPIKVMTVRTTAFSAVNAGNQKAKITELTQNVPVFEGVSFKEAQVPTLTRPELTAAKIVVSGGRGLKSAENFKMIEQLADKLGAAVGASRAAVDAGFVPNDFQVGQTGKIVAPSLYIAIGISGAIQHLAGMKDSKVIVAINKDGEAPIFQVADYGLVGDLFTILPELETALGK
jgi:electron transfer flavoprotein alpha subunit